MRRSLDIDVFPAGYRNGVVRQRVFAVQSPRLGVRVVDGERLVTVVRHASLLAVEGAVEGYERLGEGGSRTEEK